MLLGTNTPTLVCCGAGMSRAPAIAAAAIATITGRSMEECLAEVARSGARDVSPGFWQAGAVAAARIAWWSWRTL